MARINIPPDDSEVSQTRPSVAVDLILGDDRYEALSVANFRAASDYSLDKEEPDAKQYNHPRLLQFRAPLPKRTIASNYLRKAGEVHGTVEIHISIVDSPGNGLAWGCDLSCDYVKINAEYTT